MGSPRLSLRTEIRRFDVFAEWNRLKTWMRPPARCRASHSWNHDSSVRRGDSRMMTILMLIFARGHLTQ